MSDVVKKFFKERHAKENRKQEKEKEREEAKKKGSTFHHKVEGKMIKKVMRKVKFIYCI